MAILLLKIAAPLQSWGINSKFNIRRTNDFPTKSAIVGMIASAMRTFDRLSYCFSWWPIYNIQALS